MDLPLGIELHVFHNPSLGIELQVFHTNPPLGIELQVFGSTSGYRFTGVS